MQHKAELGTKTVTKVTVFRAETDDDLAFVDANLLFHVEDVKDEEGDESRQNGEVHGDAKLPAKRFKL